jgi:hypothetical protein
LKFAPMDVDAPVASAPFQSALVTVTALALCVQVPFHPDWSVWVPANEYCNDQLVSAGPLLVMLMDTPKPVPQSVLTDQVTWHDGVVAAGATAAGAGAVPPAATALLPPTATTAATHARHDSNTVSDLNRIRRLLVRIQHSPH